MGANACSKARVSNLQLPTYGLGPDRGRIPGGGEGNESAGWQQVSGLMVRAGMFLKGIQRTSSLKALRSEYRYSIEG